MSAIIQHIDALLEKAILKDKSPQSWKDGHLLVHDPLLFHLILCNELSENFPLILHREDDLFEIKEEFVVGYQIKKEKSHDHEVFIQTTLFLSNEKNLLLNYYLTLDQQGAIIKGQWHSQKSPLEWCQVLPSRQILYEHYDTSSKPSSYFLHNFKVEGLLSKNLLENPLLFEKFHLLRPSFEEGLFQHDRVLRRLIAQAFKQWAFRWDPLTFLNHLYFSSYRHFRKNLIEQYCAIRGDSLEEQEKISLRKVAV